MYKLFYSNKLFITILAILVLMISGFVLQTIYNYQTIVVILLFLIFIIPIFGKLIRGVFDSSAVLYLLFCFMIFITMVTHISDNSFNYIYSLALITAAYGISLTYNFDRFVNLFLKLMTVITVIALVSYIVLQIAGQLDFLPLLTNKKGTTYSIGIIFNYITWLPDRNCAVFWEPGLYATFLIWSIIFEIVFKKEKKSWFRLILFLAGIITAHSSAGYLLVLICFVLLLVQKKKRISIWNILVLAAVLILLMNLDNIILSTPLAGNQYVAKLLSENIKDSSRYNAVIYNLGVFRDTPVFGAGVNYIKESVIDIADTSTSTYLMAVYGVLGSLYTFAFVYGILRLKGVNIYSKICILIIVLSILNKEPHFSNLFTWLLLFYFLQYNPNKKPQRQRRLIIEND